MGHLLQRYDKNPKDSEVRIDISENTRILPGPIERKQGKLLENDVKVGR